MSERRPPFLVDYTIDGRLFSVLLAPPTSWAEAEAHLAAIAATGKVVGSDVEEFPARALDAWTAAGDALLNAATASGKQGEIALAGAAVMVAAAVAAGLDADQATTCAAAMIGDVYRLEGAA